MIRSISILCLLAAASAVHVDRRDADDTSVQEASVDSPDSAEVPAPTPEPKGFMETLRDMQRRWRAHKRLQMQTLEPWKVKKYEEEKLRHRAERAEVERRHRQEVTGVEQPTVEDQAALEEEKKSNETNKVEKFGEQYTFLVQDMSGEEFKVKFRTKTHMRVLMNSVIQRLDLTPDEGAQVRFTFGDKEITSQDTAEQLGMHDQDVIMLGGQLMEKKALEKQAATGRARARMQLDAKADSVKSHERMFEDRKNIEKERRLQSVKHQEALNQHFRENSLIHLNFTDGHEKSVRLGVKRENWLGPVFQIACKRLGIPLEATHFKADVNGATTIITSSDTFDGLGLRPDAVITVKHNNRASAEAAVEGPII